MRNLLVEYGHSKHSRGRNRHGLGFASVLIFLLTAASCLGASLTASLDRDAIMLGETATLSLTFSGVTPQGTPNLPSVPNLNISGVGSSSQFTFENGQASQSISYNYVLSPRQAGNFTIPAITVAVAGQRLTSQALTLRVGKPGPPSAQAIQSGSQPAFLKLLLPKKELYLGETFTIQVQLYFLSQIQRISQFQFTGFPADGFTVGKMAEKGHYQTQIGNSVYTVVPVDVALKTVKEGALTIGPVTANVVLGGRDPMDLFGMFEGGTQARRIALATESLSVRSLPLPQDQVPADFNGAVGVYSMSLTAGPTNLMVGDPITVKIQISGRGSLDSIVLPPEPAWHDFKIYPPTTKVQLSDQLGLQGTKTFEQILQPENADIKMLPAVSFSFFDPDQKRYRTLTQPAVPLFVRSAGAAPAPTVLAAADHAQNNSLPGQDIVPNKQRLGAIAQIGPPLLTRSWFLALQAVPLLGFLGSVTWRKRAESLANNPKLRRQRHVAQVVRAGLKDLRELAAQNRSDEFFATLFRILQEQLGERLDVPATAVTESVVEEQLRPRGVPDQTLAPLQDLFQACNLARFAPVKNSQELAAFVPRLEEVLHQLQEVKL